MPSSREGIKEGFKGIITNLKQSGIGKAGSKIYQVLRPAVQGAKTVVSKGYNAIKETVEPVVEKGASFFGRAKNFFGKLFGYETEQVAGKVGEEVTSIATKNAAEEVGKLFNGIVQKADGAGWKVTITGKTGKPIVVRIMEAGSGGRATSYYRVSIDGKGSLDLAGKISDNRALTHIDLTGKYLDEIKNIINNHWGV